MIVKFIGSEIQPVVVFFLRVLELSPDGVLWKKKKNIEFELFWWLRKNYDLIITAMHFDTSTMILPSVGRIL